LGVERVESPLKLRDRKSVMMEVLGRIRHKPKYSEKFMSIIAVHAAYILRGGSLCV